MRNKVFYIKSYSKGQFTLPKEVRDALDLGEDFWLEMTVEGNRMVVKKAEPMDRVREPVTAEYIAGVKKLTGTWALEDDWKKIRKEFDERAKKYDW